MTRLKKIFRLDSFFIILILGIFALASIILLIFGAKIYSNVLRDGKNTSDMRASLAYLSNKIRYADQAGAISVDGDTVCIAEQGETVTVYTYIYFKDGRLLEQTVIDKADFKPEQGENIISLHDYKVNFEKNMFTFAVLDLNNQEHTVSLTLRSSVDE